MKYNEKYIQVYDYLVERTQNGLKIPNPVDLSKILGMTTGSIYYSLDKLGKLGKIKYKKGKISMILTPSVSGNRQREFKSVIQQKNISFVEMSKKYDTIVKDLISDYIKSIPSEELSSEKIGSYVTSILNITNYIKSKLFE